MAQGILAGRVALVTGAGGGIGRAAALALAAAGAQVIVNDVNPNRLEDVVNTIHAAGGMALGWLADISNKFQVGAMIERARDEYGGLHAVVNAWAVNKRQPFLTLDEYDWRRVLEINLTGVFFVSQLAARVLADEGGGVIVQVVGAAGPLDAHDQTPYRVSQAGIAALAGAMAAELGVRGVVVRVVEAGADEAASAAQIVQVVAGAA